ncbi:aminoglycoside phosphotransferase family protein [Pseudonocardia sp. HH130630-07]|uniref:aminoglycoside phosphotransferase family protein n=1 Tax=Pseudonocardia sp. HH130630-07 TaxID=1690815 RepID=UPI00081517A6|nr:aminoglycoside phosphotransferase family protein [Pseudonocardia sp. HH130630-07]ANY07334.1 hypothetical protein AFB00_14735 [Pseudonocardia sp. HH130630-07]
MTGLRPDVAHAATARWPDRARAWIDALPTELTDVCADLAVTPTGQIFRARFAHVVEATSVTGAHLVLRSSPDHDAVHQAAVLDRLACVDLAPAVHLVRQTQTSTWTAMDAVTPGTSLAEDEPNPADLEAVAIKLRTLLDQPGAPKAPSIIPWLRGRLIDPPIDNQPPHRGPAAPADRRAAIAVLDQLDNGASDRLCHADLSPPNVLRGHSRLWVIDPRGMNGEAAYDVAVLALKLSDDQFDTTRPHARSIAITSGADADRAEAWVTVVDAGTV